MSSGGDGDPLDAKGPRDHAVHGRRAVRATPGRAQEVALQEERDPGAGPAIRAAAQSADHGPFDRLDGDAQIRRVLLGDLARMPAAQDRLEARVAADVGGLPDEVHARARPLAVGVGSTRSPWGLRGEHVLGEAGGDSQDERDDQGYDEGRNVSVHDTGELLSASRSGLLKADKTLQYSKNERPNVVEFWENVKTRGSFIKKETDSI